MELLQKELSEYVLLSSLACNFTKFNFGRGSAQDPAGEAYNAPQILMAVAWLH